MDILLLHVLPRLQAQDIQALAHICTLLSTLVSSGLPDSTWASVPANTFPAGHPLLAAADTPQHIQQLTAIRAALSSGRLAASAECCLWEGLCSVLHTEALVSYAGTMLIAYHNSQLRLYQLNLGSDVAGVSLAWS